MSSDRPGASAISISRGGRRREGKRENIEEALAHASEILSLTIEESTPIHEIIEKLRESGEPLETITRMGVEELVLHGRTEHRAYRRATNNILLAIYTLQAEMGEAGGMVETHIRERIKDVEAGIRNSTIDRVMALSKFLGRRDMLGHVVRALFQMMTNVNRKVRESAVQKTFEHRETLVGIVGKEHLGLVESALLNLLDYHIYKLERGSSSIRKVLKIVGLFYKNGVLAFGSLMKITEFGSLGHLIEAEGEESKRNLIFGGISKIMRRELVKKRFIKTLLAGQAQVVGNAEGHVNLNLVAIIRFLVSKYRKGHVSYRQALACLLSNPSSLSRASSLLALHLIDSLVLSRHFGPNEDIHSLYIPFMDSLLSRSTSDGQILLAITDIYMHLGESGRVEGTYISSALEKVSEAVGQESLEAFTIRVEKMAGRSEMKGVLGKMVNRASEETEKIRVIVRHVNIIEYLDADKLHSLVNRESETNYYLILWCVYLVRSGSSLPPVLGKIEILPIKERDIKESIDFRVILGKVRGTRGLQREISLLERALDKELESFFLRLLEEMRLSREMVLKNFSAVESLAEHIFGGKMGGKRNLFQAHLVGEVVRRNARTLVLILFYFINITSLYNTLLFISRRYRDAIDLSGDVEEEEVLKKYGIMRGTEKRFAKAMKILKEEKKGKRAKRTSEARPEDVSSLSCVTNTNLDTFEEGIASTRTSEEWRRDGHSAGE
jgi:hypothetical protein